MSAGHQDGARIVQHCSSAATAAHLDVDRAQRGHGDVVLQVRGQVQGLRGPEKALTIKVTSKT